MHLDLGVVQIFLLYPAWVQKGLLIVWKTLAFWLAFSKTVSNCSCQQSWWVNLIADGVTRPTTYSQSCACVRVNTHAWTHTNKYTTVYMQMFSSNCFQWKKLYLSRKMQLPLALDLLIHQSSLALLHWCRESQMLLIPVYSCFPSSEMHHTESSYQQIWSYLYFQTFTNLITLSFPRLSLCKWSLDCRWWDRLALQFFTLEGETCPRTSFLGTIPGEIILSHKILWSIFRFSGLLRIGFFFW